MPQLTFNPGSTLSGFRTIRPWPLVLFFLSPIGSTETENIIYVPQFNQGFWLIQYFNLCLSIPLQLLSNCSFSTGLVPYEFKVVRVVPIDKKGSSYLVSSYRPISMHSIFNNIIEKLMYNRIISYLENFFYSTQ